MFHYLSHLHLSTRGPQYICRDTCVPLVISNNKQQHRVRSNKLLMFEFEFEEINQWAEMANGDEGGRPAG
jgi:hypothetical protein